MAYQVLNPELAKYLLRGEVDELTPRHNARIDKIKATPCPRCGASLHPRVNDLNPPKQPGERGSFFSPHDPLPRMLATCSCGVVLDLDTGLVVDRGSAAKVDDPLPIIKVDDE